MTETSPTASSHSVWSPLRRPLFRDRLAASVVSNTGSWMQDTVGTWLMTVLTASPLLIALMQTAASLPVLLLGLGAVCGAMLLPRLRQRLPPDAHGHRVRAYNGHRRIGRRAGARPTFPADALCRA